MRSRLMAFVTAIVVAHATRSGAVTSIRYDGWYVGSGMVAHDVVAPIDTVSYVSVGFDATSTAADLAGGFRFAIAERDPGTNQVLARFQIGPCIAVAPVGSEINVGLSLALYCDALGNLHVRDARDPAVTWCDYPTQQVCGGGTRFPATALPGVSEPERFELVVLDENDQEQPNPMPEDALQCGDGGALKLPLGPGRADLARADGIPPRTYPQSGAIGIFADPGGTLCADHITPLVPFRWYVVERLAGMTRCGTQVVELGIHGLPPGFFISNTPNPDAFGVFGNPFTWGALAFECERGAGDAIVLYTLNGISNVAVQDLVLEVGAGDPPSNPYMPFPWSELCPMPGNISRQLDKLKFIVNPTQQQACDITVPATLATWGQVKELYRNAP